VVWDKISAVLLYLLVMLKLDFLHSRLPFCEDGFLPVIETSLLPKSTIINVA